MLRRLVDSQKIDAITPFAIDKLENANRMLSHVLNHTVQLPVVHRFFSSVDDDRFKFERGLADLPPDVLRDACKAFGSVDYCCLDIPVRKECAEHIQCAS